MSRQFGRGFMKAKTSVRLVVNCWHSLLLAVVAVGVRAAAVAVVDGAGGGHVQGAEVVVARALAVELARAEGCPGRL